MPASALFMGYRDRDVLVASVKVANDGRDDYPAYTAVVVIGWQELGSEMDGKMQIIVCFSAMTSFENEEVKAGAVLEMLIVKVPDIVVPPLVAQTMKVQMPTSELVEGVKDMTV